MKNFLYLWGCIVFLLAACSDDKPSRHYTIEKKHKLEKELDDSFNRNMNQLQSQDDL